MKRGFQAAFLLLNNVGIRNGTYCLETDWWTCQRSKVTREGKTRRHN